MALKTLLITGTSNGLGNLIALQALERGHKVIATSRTVEKLEPLRKKGAITVAFDVNASQDAINAAAKDILDSHGPVDVVLNNAGYIFTGTMEEVTDEELKKQFETNVFGPVKILRAFLPPMRQRRSGTVVFFGSLASWRQLPVVGSYISSKHALRAIASSFMEELKPLNIRTILIEPGYTRTNFLSSQGDRNGSANKISDYDSIRDGLVEGLNKRHNNQPGDPDKVARITLDAIDDETKMTDWIPTGSDFYDIITGVLQNNLKELKEKEILIRSADFDN